MILRNCVKTAILAKTNSEQSLFIIWLTLNRSVHATIVEIFVTKYSLNLITPTVKIAPLNRIAKYLFSMNESKYMLKYLLYRIEKLRYRLHHRMCVISDFSKLVRN